MGEVTFVPDTNNGKTTNSSVVFTPDKKTDKLDLGGMFTIPQWIEEVGQRWEGRDEEVQTTIEDWRAGELDTNTGVEWLDSLAGDAQFKIQNMFKEMAIASGVGLRVDLEYFIVRLDLGFPIYNPAYSKGARWTFQDLGDRETYIQEGIDRFILPGDSPESARARASWEYGELLSTATATTTFSVSIFRISGMDFNLGLAITSI